MKKPIFYTFAILWACAVIACIVVVERYANTSGEAAPLHAEWPSETQLVRSGNIPAVVIFSHPKCPCTQASIQEFQRLEARHPGAFETLAVFTVPAEESTEWESSRLIQQARNLQSAHLVFDRGGVEAARFHAHVSGQVLLFSPDGRLLYSGGVTAARGHEGANGGLDAIEYMLAHPDSAPKTFPVFGCGLINSDTRANAQEPA